MINVLILGSTSHIAKGLIYNFKQDKKYNLITWSRSIDKNNILFSYFDLINKYDIIINCVGKGKASSLSSINYDDIYFYNKLDTMIIDYLKNNNKCLYFNISSWVAGEDLKEDHRHYIYATNKKYLEMKHRLLPELNIIDLRIHAYFSRWIDLDSGFLLSDILNHTKNGKEFKLTTKEDKPIYISTPYTLFNIIISLYNDYMIKNIIYNQDYSDLYNLTSISDILDYFKIKHNLFNPFIKKNNIPVQLENEIKEWYKLNGI